MKPEYQPFINDIESLIIAFDQDEPGRKGTEKLTALGEQIRAAPPLPMGKDLSEFHQLGGDVFTWLFEALGV